jgi:hypothetical protein
MGAALDVARPDPGCADFMVQGPWVHQMVLCASWYQRDAEIERYRERRGRDGWSARRGARPDHVVVGPGRTGRALDGDDMWEREVRPSGGRLKLRLRGLL